MIREIHRRSLWQVLGIYLAGSWIALQVVDVLRDNFGLPEWFPALALAFLVLGLPVVLATAFVQEGVGSGGRDDGEALSEDVPSRMPGGKEGAQRVEHRVFTWRNAMLGGVAAFAVWGVVAAGWLAVGGATGVRGAVADDPGQDDDIRLRSIAVLPFVTRSTSQEDRFFAEGMHDDLLTQLAKIDSLTVISRTSVMQYAGTTKTIGEIGAELAVATVLEGGVQRSGDRVRVNVQLIEASTDRHLWAETYDEELTANNVFAIQSDLARAIADALHTTLSPTVERRIETRPTESLEAYDLYARARYGLINRVFFGEDIQGVRALFERVIAADSSFAGAWAGLAETHLADWNWSRVPQEEAQPLARAAIDRALTLDPDLAEAHLAQARLLGLSNRPDEALESARRALGIKPGDAEILAIVGRLLQQRGDYAEAIETARRAVELDPLNVASRHSLADRLFFAGRFDESIAEARKAVEMAPNDWYGWYNLGWSHAAAGRSAEAVAALHRARPLSEENAPSIDMGLAYAFARGGQRDSAEVYLAAVPEGSGGYDRALVQFELGDTDRAFSSLAASLAEDPTSLHRLEGDPTAARLRQHPRFDEVLDRLGLVRGQAGIRTP